MSEIKSIGELFEECNDYLKMKEIEERKYFKVLGSFYRYDGQVYTEWSSEVLSKWYKNKKI